MDTPKLPDDDSRNGDSDLPKTRLDYALLLIIGLWPTMNGKYASKDVVLQTFKDSCFDFEEELLDEAWERLTGAGFLKVPEDYE